MKGIAYSYHPQTGLYLGEVQCQPNPLEVGEYIIPGHATDVKPPKPTKGKEPFWNGEGWELQAVSAE